MLLITFVQKVVLNRRRWNMPGTEDATKTLPTINTSNAFRFDCCSIVKKSRNKSETNISGKVCRDINIWLNKDDLCFLEARKARVTCIISRREVYKMVEQELNKTKRNRKLRTDTIKQSRAAINKKIVELKVKDLINKTRTFQFKTKGTKTPKARPILKIHEDPFKIFLIINTQNSLIYTKSKRK